MRFVFAKASMTSTTYISSSLSRRILTLLTRYDDWVAIWRNDNEMRTFSPRHARSGLIQSACLSNQTRSEESEKFMKFLSVRAVFSSFTFVQQELFCRRLFGLLHRDAIRRRKIYFDGNWFVFLVLIVDINFVSRLVRVISYANSTSVQHQFRALSKHNRRNLEEIFRV